MNLLIDAPSFYLGVASSNVRSTIIVLNDKGSRRNITIRPLTPYNRFQYYVTKTFHNCKLIIEKGQGTILWLFETALIGSF